MAATGGGSRSATGGSPHMAVRRGRRAWLLLDDRQDVARRVLEPGDRRALAAEDAPLVLLEALVALEDHAALGQGVHGRLDVVDREVEDRVGRRDVVRLGVDHDLPVAGEPQVEQAVLLLHAQPQGVAVEPGGLLDVRHREAAECPAIGQHAVLLSVRARPPTAGRSGCRAPPAGPAAGAPAAAGPPRRRRAGAGRSARTAARPAPGRSGRRPGRCAPSPAWGRTAARPGSRRAAAAASPGSGTGGPTDAPGAA